MRRRRKKTLNVSCLIFISLATYTWTIIKYCSVCFIFFIPISDALHFYSFFFAIELVEWHKYDIDVIPSHNNFTERDIIWTNLWKRSVLRVFAATYYTIVCALCYVYSIFVWSVKQWKCIQYYSIYIFNWIIFSTWKCFTGDDFVMNALNTLKCFCCQQFG